MKKGYNVLLDYVYDYNILTYEDDKDFGVNAHNFTVLYADFLSTKYIVRKNLIKNLQKSTKLKSVSVKDFLAINDEAEEIAFEIIKKPMVKLAKMGYPKAVALYLTTHKVSERDPEIVKIAKDFEKLDFKTPDQFEAVAALHLYDIFKINNKDITVKQAGYYSLLGYYMQNRGKKKKEYQTIGEGQKSAAYRNIVMNSPYGEAMARAQLGYYIKTMKAYYIKNVGNYFNVNSDFNISLVPTEVLQEYSEGTYYTNQKLKKIIIQNQGSTPPKDWPIEERITYGIAFLNFPKNEQERKKGVKILLNIANEPIIIEDKAKTK